MDVVMAEKWEALGKQAEEWEEAGKWGALGKEGENALLFVCSCYSVPKDWCFGVFFFVLSDWASTA
jgi:hypothetical protein